MTKLLALLAVVIMLTSVMAAAQPVSASNNDIAACKYGSVFVVKSGVGSYRCRTWTEYAKTKVAASAAAALKSAQSSYDARVTKPIVKTGNSLAAPVVKNSTMNNAWWLLRQGR